MLKCFYSLAEVKFTFEVQKAGMLHVYCAHSCEQQIIKQQLRFIQDSESYMIHLDIIWHKNKHIS